MDRILNKLLSARWLIAVITTVAFSTLAIMGKLNTEFLSVYTLVIAFYFNKDRNTTDTVSTSVIADTTIAPIAPAENLEKEGTNIEE
jgi:hypothetical protein